MNEFTKDAEYIYINKPCAEAYIPEVIFGDPDKPSTIASEYGLGIRSIGIFYMRFFDDENQKRSDAPLVTFNYPNMIEMYPTSITKEKITIDEDTEEYRVLHFVKGDIMMNSYIKKSASNCETFLTLITTGKIPKSLSYEGILQACMKNFEINDVNPGVPSVTLQLIISEMCRYRKDPAIPFRKIAGRGNADMHDYKAANMNEVSAYSSVMSALTFERFSDKLASSLYMTKTGAAQTKSPIEKIISY